MKQKILRIDAEEIENLHNRQRPTPKKFLRYEGADEKTEKRNAMVELRYDFVNFILSRLNDLTLPFLTGQATRFELWADDQDVNHKAETKLFIRFWVKVPSIKRGLMQFEYPIN